MGAGRLLSLPRIPCRLLGGFFTPTVGSRQVDWQTVVNVLVGGVVPAVLFLVKRQADRDKEFTDFRVEVARDYVRHTHLEEIRESLRQILSFLDGKADKRPYREGN